MPFIDPSPEYWREYSNLQRVKHDLIRAYFNGWFPKLGFWAGRILYVDTHAGRGSHVGGQLGSPLVVLDALQSHAARDKILTKSEIVFFFIERVPEYAQELQGELARYSELPSRVECNVVSGDCFEFLSSVIKSLRGPGGQSAPAFFFIDPYGFKVPGDILRQLMSSKRVELFVNVIWRELDMALRQPDTMADTLNFIFDGDAWRTRITAEGHVERSSQAIDLFRDVTRARWATPIRMLGPNGVTRYLLLHLTNSDDGRDLMKKCIWDICPDGGYYARRTDDPKQEYLIQPQPDLGPLRDWVLSRLPARWQRLKTDLRATIWRDPHLTEVVRQLRKNNIIDGRNYVGKFNPKADPELYKKE